MKVSIFWCVLVGLVAAVPLAHNSSLRVLSAHESTSVRGAQLLEFHPWTRCGVTNECRRNTCSVDNCSGYKTTPEEGVSNTGCNDINWLSACWEEHLSNIFEVVPACATKGGTCWPTIEMVDGVEKVTSCEEAVTEGTIPVPKAPAGCLSLSLEDLLFP